MNRKRARYGIPQGFKLRYTLRRHKNRIIKIAWSPDGKRLASPSFDRTICIWDTETGKFSQKLKGHECEVGNAAWSPDGKIIAAGARDGTVRLWNTKNGKYMRELKGHSQLVRSVSWSPDGHILASSSDDHTVIFWDPVNGLELRSFQENARIPYVLWTPKGDKIISASDDSCIRIYDTKTFKKLITLRGHTSHVLNLALSPDERTLASASTDNTIRIWDIEKGKTMHILEGHTRTVGGVSFSSAGDFLASRSSDSTVRLWRCDTWESIAVMDELAFGPVILWHSNLAFHPRDYYLATIGEDDMVIHIWDLDVTLLLGMLSPRTSVRYTNAKVVLVGDTGVGKTGLGYVLTGKKFEPTESTHGRHVWIFDSHGVKDGVGVIETRETLLWDLAGQPGYRLIHQLHLKEVAVALVVFDARSETEPFAGVKHWNRALRQAQRYHGNDTWSFKKFLVSARSDRGGIPVSQKRITALINELAYDGYFETSAKEGWGIDELIKSIKECIDWNSLPKVSSNELFRFIKQFLIGEKKRGRVLSTSVDLYRTFVQLYSSLTQDNDIREEFNVCIVLLESQDLIRRLSFGGFVLLQPELLDAYASDIINAAKDEPDGLGCILEEDVLNCRFKIPDIERIKDKQQERLLLIATIEELQRHELVLKEVTDKGTELVFPSQFTREKPDAPDVLGKSVIFDFEGPILNIYTTMAVRIAHSYLFKKKNMWKNAAAYQANIGGTCGIVLIEVDEGHGQLILFYDPLTTEAIRFQFEEYVAAHLNRRALPKTIKRRRIVVCEECGEPIPDSTVRRRRERGHNTLHCPVCEKKMNIVDFEERSVINLPSTIEEIDRNADCIRDLETCATILKGKIETVDFDVFLCHNSADKQTVKQIGERLKERGILPWLDEWELRPGLPFQKALEEQIKKIKTAAVFVGKDGIGPWEDMEMLAFLRQFVKRNCPVIPVILDGCQLTPELPTFLEGMTFVDFRNQDPDPFEQLIWGITGERLTPGF